MTNDLTDRILRALQFEHCDNLFWRVGSYENPNDNIIHFYINCNDLFYWACSDLEEITEENIELLEKTLKELDTHHACDLFCCRSRKMRPQKPMYQHFNIEEVKLFNACGEERNDDD